jgi:hypothetical protein
MGDRFILAIVMSAMISACASSSQVLMTGTSRAAVSPDDVRVYTRAPTRFEEIAVLRASSRGVSTAGGEHVIEKVIKTLRAQAARLGANGLLLEDLSDARSVNLGTSVGTDIYTHNASINIGVGGSLGIANKIGQGRAIFVTPEN